jgi:hypothetical protein
MTYVTKNECRPTKQMLRFFSLSCVTSDAHGGALLLTGLRAGSAVGGGPVVGVVETEGWALDGSAWSAGRRECNTAPML